MEISEKLKKTLLKRVYYEQPISHKPMHDGFAVCLLNRTELNEDEQAFIKYWTIDNKENLKRIENETN